MHKLSAKNSLKKLVLIIIFSCLSLLLLGCGEQKVEQQSAPPVIRPALIEIASTTQSGTLSFNGVIRAAERADLSFRVGGSIIELLVEEGDSVRKGQILAKLDSKDAETALTSARLELKNVEAEYKRSKAIYDKSKAISKSQLDEITTRYNLAKNSANEAQRQLGYTKITAPFDGIIGQKFVDNYVQIQANSPVFTIHDLSDLEVVIQIPDKVMLSSTTSRQAKAEISGIPNTLFDLTLRTYATQADPVSQTYAVVLGLNDVKGYRVLPGMVAKVIPAEAIQDESVITLPIIAVVPDNQGKQYVWVVNADNKVSKRYVEVGTLSGERVVIKNNIKIGEQIVVAGMSSLQDGMEIRPMKSENK